MWRTLVKVSSIDELRVALPTVSELSKGTEAIIRIEMPTWLPIGKLADLAGAEWWAGQLIGAGMEIDDVYGDWHWMEVRGKADPLWLIPLIPLIIKALTMLGLAGFFTWLAVTVSANIFVKPAEIAYEREQAKMEFIEERLREGYTPEQVTRWLEGVESPPPEVSLPEWLAPAGIGMGAILLVGLAVLLLMRK